MRTKIPLLLLALLSIGIHPIRAEHILTNSDIIDLVKAKIPASVIVDEIQRSKCNFSTVPQDLINLKKAGDTYIVLGAMVKAKHATSAPVATVPPLPITRQHLMSASTTERMVPE